jgi:alkylation response protein AidB-like acyl-CoA dehydrogenase
MELAQTADEADFRARARAWLRSNVPRGRRPTVTGPASRAYDTAWQRMQYEGGWAGISWPRDAGGLGLSLTHQVIWHEEYALAEAPPPGCMFIALNHGGPTLILRGNDEQRKKHLSRILKGEDVWCQGFSEPGAGSDLAAIQTRGVIDGGCLIVNGSKIWTTVGHIADKQELLVRTDPTAGRHGGMTWVICDMRAPGITVRPLKMISEDMNLNQVFYDNVRIPLENVVGEVNDGWSVAMSTLSLERGVALVPYQMEMATRLERLIDLSRHRVGPDGVRTAFEHDDIALRLAKCRAEAAATRAMIYLGASRGLRQSVPGSEGAMSALQHAELTQRIQALALEIIGPEYLDYYGDFGVWSHDYLESFKHTVAGGTSEIRRNIIAERVLGMPRDRPR